MAQPQVSTTECFEGDGWRAVRYDTWAVLHVAPEADVASAVAGFLGSDAAPDWAVQMLHIDCQGWDVFMVEQLGD